MMERTKRADPPAEPLAKEDRNAQSHQRQKQSNRDRGTCKPGCKQHKGVQLEEESDRSSRPVYRMVRRLQEQVQKQQ
jgi:hypothetical protein